MADPIDKVRVAVLGTGFGRYGHLPGFSHVPGAEVVALYSTPLDEAQTVAKEFGVAAAYDDWQRLLLEVRPDLVSIVLPPFLHFPVVMAALETGCHVLCEKPLALDVEEARRMLLKAEASRRIHMVDHQLRFNPLLRHLKDLIDQGYVGRIRHVRFRNINANRGDPQVPWNWSSDLHAGGGTLMAGASHHVDLMRWLFGEIVAVCSQQATHILERRHSQRQEMLPVTSEDQYSLILELEHDVTAWLFATSVARHPLGLRLEVVGSEGTLIVEEPGHLRGARSNEALQEISVPDPYAGLEGVADFIWTTSFVGLARELVAAIHGGRPLQAGATFRDGLRTQAVLEAARRSWAERRWVDVPAV